MQLARYKGRRYNSNQFLDFNEHPFLKDERCIFTKISAISGNILFKKDSSIPQINLKIFIYKKLRGISGNVDIFSFKTSKIQKSIEYK